MRFAANLKWLFTELPFEARFDAAAAAGFEGVEYASPYDHDPVKLDGLLRAAGLKQVLINTPADADACRADGFRDGFERAMEYALVLDAGLVHVRAGARPEGVSQERAYARLITNLAWAADQSSGSGVSLVLEAQNRRDNPGRVLRTQAEAAAIAEALDAGHVGVLLDLYHAQIDEGDLITKVRELQPYTLHYQVADPPGRHEPGTGEIGWPAVFAAIRAGGYEGWIGCEYEPRDRTLDGLGWIEELAG
ncbi:hydroxypyruvate isomerase family protein [Nonomuraea typhae]|uniref:hydroxypyruvate isomerase family protein n=1 Tax=Nonomuraea typhae TaxID=2603600 RepID=UPI0012F789FA|nr:TIM barrel protein [Nonomuraea typhae]